jgi:hypothetical protein
MSLRKPEETNSSDLKRRQFAHDGMRNWSWYEWIYGNHMKETLSKKRKKLGEYFVKYVSNYNGIPTEYRCEVWKTLLGVNEDISAREYIRLIKLGRCHVYEKIKCDTFRTLATDKKFKSMVSEDQLTRVLNAFAQKSKEGNFFKLYKKNLPPLIKFTSKIFICSGNECNSRSILICYARIRCLLFI